MYMWVFVIHISIFILLAYLVSIKRNYLHPAVFLLMFNYFYFFIFWYIGFRFILNNSDYLNHCFVGYYYALFYGVGLIVGILLSSSIVRKFPITKFISLLTNFISFSFSSSLLLLLLSITFFIYLNYSAVKTLNPKDILVIREIMASQGEIIRTKVAYLTPIFHNLIYFFLICVSYFLLKKRKWKHNIFYFLLCIIAIYAMLFTASKSSILFVIVYGIFVYHNFIKRISPVFLVSFAIIFFILVPYLEILRQGLELQDFRMLLTTFFGRMNFNYYLSRFLISENYQHFDYTWSFPWMFGYLVPRTIWDLLGEEKPIPFGLTYTRFVVGDNSIFMTVASAGIGEWIHNYSNILNLPVSLSVFLGGFFNGLVFVVFKRVLDIAIDSNNIFMFAVCLILLHIGEPIFDSCFYTTYANTLVNLFSLIFPLIALSLIFKLIRVRGVKV